MTIAIDVSSENGPNIHWGKVRAAGVELVILRVTKVGLEEDPLCHIHARGARSAGLRVSAYGFSQPNLGGPEAQAGLARAIADDIGAEGLADDAEIAGGLPPAELAAWHRTYLDTADRPGSRTQLYTGPRWCKVDAKGHTAGFASRALWLANYGASVPDVPFPWLSYALWQRAGNTIAQLVKPWRAQAVGAQIWGAAAIAAIKDGAARLLAAAGHVDGVPGEVDCNVLGPGVELDAFLRGDPISVAPDLRSALGRQQALRALGHDPGMLDGAWGANSRAALVMVQRELSLSVDGTWGPKTESAVRDALAAIGVIAAP